MTTLAARKVRISALAQRADHARELLSALDLLLEEQERIGGAIGVSTIDAASLAAIPFGALGDAFGDFVEGLVPGLTSQLRVVGEQLLSRRTSWEPLLAAAARRASLQPFAQETDGGEVGLRFFSYAFLQPVARRFAQAREASEAPPAMRRCPVCGWPPLAAQLADSEETKGRRSLVCSLCDTPWRYPRAECANCGERGSEQLVLHESESHRHIRIDECRTCGAYLKTMDLRRDGRADPLVDDVASLELDLWADGRGMWKIQRNVFGL